MQDGNRKSKQNEMEIKNTKRLEKIIDIEDRLRKVKNKQSIIRFLKEVNQWCTKVQREG